jgi:sec-independent protein translocase protein TatA
MLGNLGFWEILIIAMVFLLVFGARRLPEIGQSLGKGIREFKKSVSEASDALNAPSSDDRPAAPPRQYESAPPASSGEPKRLSQ